LPSTATKPDVAADFGDLGVALDGVDAQVAGDQPRREVPLDLAGGDGVDAVHDGVALDRVNREAAEDQI
jgi:hypothetical protein